MKTYKFGWIPQKPDIRDKKLPLTVRLNPPSIDLRPKDLPIMDQSQAGACTGNSSVACYDYEYTSEGLGMFRGSRLFPYFNARVIEHSANQDSGAMLRDVLKTLGTGRKGKGVCLETSWPYDINKVTIKPDKQCYKEALNHQAIQYMAVQQSPEQLKACLADGHPFVFGFTVYSNFMNIGSDGIMRMPIGSIEGGHAVMCVGYDDSQNDYIIRNSWGTSWGDKGYFYMPQEYMHNPDLCSDFWTIRKVE